MKEYFLNRDYIYLYLIPMFFKIWKTIFWIMWPVILYKNGYEIWQILMLIWISFWVMWLITPFSAILSNKIWLFRSIIMAVFFQLLTVYLLLFLWKELSILYIIILWVISSVSWGLMHPIDMFLKSNIVTDNTRWRFNSLYKISAFTGKFISILLLWLLIPAWKENILFLIVLIAYILLIITYYLLIKDKKIRIKSYNAFDIFRSYLSKNYSIFRKCFSIEWFIIIESMLIPIFMYIYVQDFQKTTLFIGISIFINFIFLLLFGKYIDKFAKKSIFISAVSKIISSFWFILYTFFPFWILFYDFISKVSDSIWSTSFYSEIQKKIKSSNDIMLNACLKEISICFFEFFVLMFMAILAYFIGEKILIVVFILWWLAPVFIYKIWKH